MIAIIGGGISGLSMAYYLKKYGIEDFVLFEKSKNLGGKIQTDIQPRYFLEKGPNTLLTTPLVEELLSELGLENEIIYPKEEQTKNRYIVKNGKIVLLPSKPQDLLFNNLLGFKSKVSALKDLTFKASKVDEYQTVSEFFKAHFSEEIVDYFVKSFCRGIYASDADELLIKSCFPQLAEYQEKYGSIIKGLKANKSLEKRKVVSFKQGLQTLITRLCHRLEKHIKWDSEVLEIKDYDSFFEIQTCTGWHTFDRVICCNEASSLAPMLDSFLPKTANALKQVKYASLTVCHSIYKQEAKNFPYQGFGVLYPPKESSIYYGHIWNSNILERLDRDKTIITTMAPLSDENKLSESLNYSFWEDYKLKPENLESRDFTVWTEGIPIYNKAHLDFVEKYESENKLKLYICSNLLSGVSIPDRILESKKLAEKLKNEK